MLRDIQKSVRLLMAKEIKDDNSGIERYRRAFKTLSGTYLAQIIAILTGLITTPLLIHYLGNERYGLMVSGTSLFFFYGYLDLGCGIGIQNGISYAYGKKDHASATVYASSGFAFYAVLAATLLLLSWLMLPHLPLQHILKIKGTIATAELLPTVLVFSMTVSLGLIAAYVQRLCDSLQQGYLTRFASVFSRIASFLFIIAGIHFKVSLPVLVTFSLMPTIASLFAYGILLKKYPWMKFQPKAISFKTIKSVISTGIHGLGAMIAYSVMLSTIPLIISNRMGAAFVIGFSVANQLVMLITNAINTISTPFWPAITEAMAKDDKVWVRKATKRFFSISIVTVILGSLAFFVFGRSIINMWTHNNAAIPSWSLLLSLSIWMILLVINANLCTVLNALTRFKGQAICGSIIAIVTIFVAYLIGPAYGVAGISWVYTGGFCIRCLCLAAELHLERRKGLFA
jgi:O-antigen/teichoic acid export membrane protein